MARDNSRAQGNGMKLRWRADIINDAAEIIMYPRNIRFPRRLVKTYIRVRASECDLACRPGSSEIRWRDRRAGA